MYFNFKAIKQLLLSFITKLTPLTFSLIILSLIYVSSTAHSLEVVSSNIPDNTLPTEASGQINTQNKTIIIINGPSTKNHFIDLLKTQGFLLVNIITKDSTLNLKDIPELENYYDTVIIQNNTSEILETLKLLFQTKKYYLTEVLAIKETDVILADILRESFNKQFNGEVFRKLNHNKISSINNLNKLIRKGVKNRLVTLEKFKKEILNQALPCNIKVMSSQQVLATYTISNPSDIKSILEKLKNYKTSDVKLWLQPYHENLYRLQIISFNNKAVPVALWHEKNSIKKSEVREEMRTLINLNESFIISQDKLTQLTQRLAEGVYLNYGLGEFVLAFHENQFEIIDYNLALPNYNQMEVMERVLGYSPLSYLLRHSALMPDLPLPKKEFKNITVVNFNLNSKNDLLKLSIMPTFYRYYLNKKDLEEVPIVGELYLVHTDKNLVVASYAGIKNMEQSLLNPMFYSHSASHIVNFYREAALNKNADYTLSKSERAQTDETKEALENLHHESQHIPKYIKPLDSKANIQDIMHYYIDIYDLYILHGKAPGTKVIPMNTGNPAFLPFPPIIEMLRKSLEENVASYAKYSMQVPGIDFINNLTRYCQEEQILVPLQKLHPNNVVIGHGSTNLYYLALKSIITNKGDIVLVTRPTYGLFIDPIYTAGGEIGFVDIKESDEWKVQPQKLHETIHFYNEKAFNNYILTTFIKEYEKFLHALDVFNLEQGALPQMPNIEGITNLAVFDKYIEKLNNFIDNISDPMVNKDELRFSFPPRVKAFYHMNPHNPTGAVYTKKDLKALAEVIQAHSDIYVIDDLAHWGVLYGEIEPATFASLEGMFEKTLTLMSLSKSYCVPGLRTGVAIGNQKIISEMQYRLLNSSSSASLPAMIALDAVFSTSKKERDTYLKSNSQEYLFRRNLMNVLINGIQQTNLSAEEKIKVYQLIIENEYKEGKPFDKKLLNLILSGMPLVRTLTDPKGCFFHLLDISKLIGAKIGDNAPLQTSTDVRNAIYSICNIDTVPGEISGNFFNYSLRMSFSLTPQQIYNACKNINLFIGNYIIKYNPSILEKNYSSNDSFLKLKKVEVLDEFIFNKALIRFYLNQAAQALMKEHDQILSLNNLQNNLKLKEIEEKVMELNNLANKILDQSFDKIIHKKIHDYIKKNQKWLRVFLPNFEELINCLEKIKG
ncbi:MAG: hypothetical protein B7Y25_05120 [Alphaproteobacteria bacterium 16-39-46]|nr:MAG: hypothetical protein B7Y25_05120 [Alphaproteobacteria bacterium 16-39-46]OZA42746.1 MAG: hypothetical protein B7X84_05030 [Alphaproteobacteria bacterium 17-39-52]HQS84284.1 pyridoxal phosphate-dependent aminotransferase [Alphaproteobacteria bacterium]HQS93129.1 pyridoxal phosphate-dependent aminotransferase [Alphaproteobacteria bacterium]